MALHQDCNMGSLEHMHGARLAARPFYNWTEQTCTTGARAAAYSQTRRKHTYSRPSKQTIRGKEDMVCCHMYVRAWEHSFHPQQLACYCRILRRRACTPTGALAACSRVREKRSESSPSPMRAVLIATGGSSAKLTFQTCACLSCVLACW